jgi:hypothetical protein
MRDRHPNEVYKKSTPQLAAKQRAETLHRFYGDPLSKLPGQAHRAAASKPDGRQ